MFYLFQALTYMKQINESERERETSWRDLPEAERADRERQLAHTGSNARYYHDLCYHFNCFLIEIFSKI